MCGLFGVLKAGSGAAPADTVARTVPFPQIEDNQHPPQVASRVGALGFEALGYLSQERGRHASGFAFFLGRKKIHPATLPSPDALNRQSLKLDGWWLRKSTRDFYQFWSGSPTRQAEYRDAATNAKVLLGHTRYATRGDKKSLANASPLLVGNLIGTHNGGVAIAELIEKYQLPAPQGETSSEIIFRSLDQALNQAQFQSQSHAETGIENQAVTPTMSGSSSTGKAIVSLPPKPDLRQIAEVLEQLRGRAALAWIDRNRPRTLYLARTALSPLAIGWDCYGNFYWASNPRWFSQLDELSNDLFQFEGVRPLEEGTLLVVEPGKSRLTQSQDRPIQMLTERHFQSYVRPQEAKLSEESLWRGLTPEQIEWEQAHLHHQSRE